jgi:ATP-dependent DNA helicase RecQ
MHHQGLIDYKKPGARGQITLLRERVPEKNFTIDQVSYAKRKDRAIARMNAMIRFMEDDILCREAFIRSYFGEEETNACGKCDRCTKREKNYADKESLRHLLREHEGITVRDFLSKYKPAQQSVIKNELRQLADEHKIRIIEDKIFGGE